MSRKVDTSKESNYDWSLHINDDGTWPTEKIQIMLLCDIRRELKKLNSLLHCSNFVAIPKVLREIRLNTTKRKRPKGKPVLRVVARS